SYELGFVEDPALVTSHVISLTGLTPATLYDFLASSVDVGGIGADTGNQEVITRVADPSGVVSDDFDMPNLDITHWTYINPLDDAKVTVVGPGPDSAQVLLDVPAGIEHKVWYDGDRAPRIMQAVQDVDFEIEAKFESSLTEKYQIEGFIIEQDPGNFMRCDFYSDGVLNYIFSARFTDGSSARVWVNQIIPTAPTRYLRLTRTGDIWTLSYSIDGSNFTVVPIITESLAVTSAGVFVSNENDPAPAHTAVVDYFFSNATRVDPEDGTPGQDTLPPLMQLLEQT